MPKVINLCQGGNTISEFANDEEMLAKGLTEYYIEARKQISLARAIIRMPYNTAWNTGDTKTKALLWKYTMPRIFTARYTRRWATRKRKRAHGNLLQDKDSISSVKNVQALSYYQTLYETEKRDSKIQAQESSIALLDEKTK